LSNFHTNSSILDPNTLTAQQTAVGFIFAFFFVFGYAWQGCVWLYCAEIAPLEYRHIGGAATASGEWLMTFITVFAGPIGFANVGWYFWLWVVVGNVLAVVFVFLLCPETGGRTLEDVDYLFVGGGLTGLRKDIGLGMDLAGRFRESEKEREIEMREDVEERG